MDAKRIVREGYNRIGERYCTWIETTRVVERTRYTKLLLDGLPAGAAVLDLGCGAGEPTTRLLTERFDVTGVDISPAQIALARQAVPEAQFIQADMTQLDFSPASFDGIAAFYSLIHIPRGEQASLLQDIASWLRPGGLLVMAMHVQPVKSDYDENFLGAPMFWSGFDSETNVRLVEAVGLQIISATCETENEFGQPVSFLWVVARKPVLVVSP